MDKLLTIAQAAELLAICPKHFRRQFVKTGEIPVVSLGKGPKGDRIRPSELQNLIGRQECYINGGASGGSNSRQKVTPIRDRLGKPASGRLRKQSAA